MLKNVLRLMLFIVLLISAMGCSSYRLVGKVMDMELKEIPNAKVTVRYADDSDSLGTVTQLDGSYVVDGIDKPNVILEVHADKYKKASKSITLKNKEQFEQITLQFKATKIIGRVLDSKSKKPLQNVLIKVLPANISVVTDEMGRFAAQQGLDPDLTNTFQFTKPNYNVNNMMVQPKRYETLDLGEIYLTAISQQLAQASDSLQSLQSHDISVSQYSYSVPIDENTMDFLYSHEHFTKEEFASKMREINPNISDETVQKNLQGLIDSNKVTLMENGTYQSNIVKQSSGF